MPTPLITPDWPVPSGVAAISTTRHSGFSAAPYDSLNLGLHVGDESSRVLQNRKWLMDDLGLTESPQWLDQVHGCDVLLSPNGSSHAPKADAVVSRTPGQPCAVMTADCLPVLFCDSNATVVAAAHAGWRGLNAGVLEQTVAAMQVSAEHVIAWLGPAIGPSRFEVGEEVRSAFLDSTAGASVAFQPSPSGRWLADLYQLARLRLERIGVSSVHGGGFCAYRESERFFSYRRDGTTGRMASLIWLKGRQTEADP